MRGTIAWVTIAMVVSATGCAFIGNDDKPKSTSSTKATSEPSPTESDEPIDEPADEPADRDRRKAPPKSIEPSSGPEKDKAELGTPDDTTASMTKAQRTAKVLSDAQALEPMLNNFWSAELRRLYGISFDTPDAFLYYRGGGNTPCGTDRKAYPNNAIYCPSDESESVQFDLSWFEEYLVEHPGGATTFLILAHEWGHAVQDTWTEQTPGTDTWEPKYRKEINADCLAGVFLARSIADGTIIEEADDSDAMLTWLYNAGAADNSRWFDPAYHGTRAERKQALMDGISKGTDFCRKTY